MTLLRGNCPFFWFYVFHFLSVADLIRVMLKCGILEMERQGWIQLLCKVGVHIE